MFKDEYTCSLVTATICPKSVGAKFNNPACIKHKERMWNTEVERHPSTTSLYPNTRDYLDKMGIGGTPYYGNQGRKDFSLGYTMTEKSLSTETYPSDSDYAARVPGSTRPACYGV